MKSNNKPTYQDLEKLINELKSEKKLKQNEDRFNKLLKASEDMITIHKPNGEYLYYNGPTCYAITPEDIVGKMPNDIFDKNISKTLLSAFEKVERTGKSETVEVLLDWLGEKKWFSEYIYPVKNTDGEIVEMVKVCRNIHQRKLAEQEIESQNKALLESENAHREVLEASSDLISVIDRNGKILFINHASKKLYGLPPKECLGKSVFDFTHPQDKEHTQAKFIEWGNSENNYFYFENRQISTSGEIFETEWSINIERKGTEIIKITSIIRDITEQNITFQKLIKSKEHTEESEERLRLLMLNMEAGIIVHAPDTSIVLNNIRASEILGISDDQMRGKKATDSVWNFVKLDKTPLPFSEYPVNRIASNKKPIKNQILGVFQPGNVNVAWVKVSGYPALSNTGDISEIVISLIDITEQKHIEEDKLSAISELKNTEKRLNEAQKVAQIGSWLYDLPDQKIEWSDETFHIWGFNSKKSAPEFDALVNRIHTDDQELFISTVQKAINLGTPYDIEHRIHLLNGKQKTIRNICKPVLGDTGQVVGLSGTTQDITKQKQAKEDKLSAILKLKNSEKRLNQAQKLAHIGSWFTSLPSQEREWSDETYHVWGFNPKKAPPGFDTLINHVHADDKELFISADDKATNLGIPYDIELRLHLSNGEQKTIRAICKPISKKNGDIIGLAGTSQDITLQKKAEEDKISTILKLENSEERLNQTQRLAKIGSWHNHLPTQKVEWSDEAFHIWGLDSKKGTPEYDSLVKLIHTDDLELFNSSYNKAINLGIPYDIESRITLPNDEQKTLRTICQPTRGDTGEVISLSGANIDITSQKTFEKAQVKHQRLKAIGEMSSSIAHDFNNSLQQMMGNLDVIKLKNEFSDSTLERLNNIGSIIDDVAERVSALQKFGDTEHDDKNAKLINFNTLIEESLMQSRPLWKDGTEKEGLKISVITDFKDIPKISCNHGELKLVVYNLIKNSIEAMPEGGDLIIKTGIKGKRVFATFTDTGIGMNEETRTKVFEPFFTTKGFKLGRGLGMSGVYNVIKKYRGDIVVKSSGLSKGATFEIFFPIGSQEEIKVTSEKEQKDKEVYNVLWVDDDTIITEDISELVDLMGHKCTIANSGKNALEYLNKNTCDVVFTDIGMPEMNGWELIEAIRNNFGDKIKIVTVTGWDIDEKTKEKHAIDFVLQKPFTLDKLEELFLKI